MAYACCLDVVMLDDMSSWLNSSSADLDVLELGCGTGLLSLALAPHVKNIVAVDISEGMISVLKSKLLTHNVTNIKPVCVLLQDPDDERIRDAPNGDPKRFDLVVSHLVLHHIPSLGPFLRTICGCLKPGGCVALTDFENFGPEARRFHPESKMEGVERHGIRQAEIAKLLADAGFKDVQVRVAFTLDKAVESGQEMAFPFLLCQAVKEHGD